RRYTSRPIGWQPKSSLEGCSSPPASSGERLDEGVAPHIRKKARFTRRVSRASLFTATNSQNERLAASILRSPVRRIGRRRSDGRSEFETNKERRLCDTCRSSSRSSETHRQHRKKWPQWVSSSSKPSAKAG